MITLITYFTEQLKKLHAAKHDTKVPIAQNILSAPHSETKLTTEQGQLLTRTTSFILTEILT